MMTVKYTDECGGAVLMTNVTELVQEREAIVLIGLLDEPQRVAGVRIAAIDFSHGVTRLATQDKP